MGRFPWIARILLSALGAALCLALIDGFLIEPNRLVSRAVTIPSPGLRSTPVRILLFSDVDFVSPGRRELALRRAALLFQPDLVLVAGDFLDRPWATRDASVLQAASEYLGSLPAPAGRFLAPGEEESPVAGRLRDAWAGGIIDVLSNESRSVEVRGERIDLFVAHPEVEPAPWVAASERGRSFVSVRGRGREQTLIYRGEGSSEWKDVDITFAFEALDGNSSLDFRFAWRDGKGPWGGDGFRLVGNEYHPDFRLHSHLQVVHRLSGPRYSGFVPPIGAWCRARIQLKDDGRFTHVRARFWKEPGPEPDGWPIEAVDTMPHRVWRGTVGFGGGYGRCRYTDLKIVSGDGKLLLQERFRDRARLRERWAYQSALADWFYTRDGARAARIVLTHNPDLVLDLADLGEPSPDLLLAGHTHGGQVRMLGIGALFTSTKIGRHYDAGLFDFQGIPMYITAGVGTSIVPIRLFDPPEVTLITLVPANDARADRTRTARLVPLDP